MPAAANRLAIPLLLLAGCSVASGSEGAPNVAAAGLRRLVEARVADGFSGVVLVSRGDEILLLDGFGAVGSRPVRPQDRFWIASTGKQFAAAGIMKLVDQRLLRLGDPLGSFFPAAPADKAGITIQQLLSHTAGFGQSYVSEGAPDRETAVARMLAEPLQQPPGSGFRYSNSNIQLAAAIIELVTGTVYAEFVARELWQPAGLANTGIAGAEASGTVSPVTGELPERLRTSAWGEQGIFSSAPDLFRWYRALTGGKVLRPESVRTLLQPVAMTGEGQAALGWFVGVSPSNRRTIFTRGNEGFGANSLLYAYPESDVLIIVLTHAGNAPGGMSWSRKLLQELEGALGL